MQGRIEGQKIIQDAVERAKLEKKRILEQAEVEVQGLKTKAQMEIESENVRFKKHFKFKLLIWQ